MNLGRAKLILIIAFAGLNLFLAYHLFWPDFGRLTRVAVTAEEMRIFEAMLESNNYELEATIERSVKTSDFLSVSTSLSLRDNILKKFEKGSAQVTAAHDTVYYRKAEEIAVVHPSGLVQVLYNPGIKFAGSSAELEERDLRDLVEQVLTERSFAFEGIAYDYMEEKPGDIKILHYYQVIEDAPVFAGRFRVLLRSNRIHSLDIYLLETLARTPIREMQVISAAEAITILVREIGVAGERRVIKKALFGYFSGEYDAEKWEIPPVWRIVLDDGRRYYVNAFTGNMEQESIIPRQLP